MKIPLNIVFLFILFNSCKQELNKIDSHNKSDTLTKTIRLNKSDSIKIYTKLKDNVKIETVSKYLDSLEKFDNEKYNILIILVEDKKIRDFEKKIRSGIY